MTNARSIVLESNGMRFPALEAGPPDGPVVLCLHGFPDTHHGFFERPAPGEASFGERLAAAGYRVVAPAMRGVTPETLPPDGDYGPFVFGKDVVAHAAALGGSVFMVANDWGAFAAYLAAAEAPDRFKRMVTLAIPHPLSIKLTPTQLWRARHFVTFQFQSRSARWLRKNDFAALATLYKRWSPHWKFEPTVFDAVKAQYAQPGVVEGALKPYKTATAGKGKVDAFLKERKIAVPTLSLGGGLDPSVPPATYEKAARGFAAEYKWDFVPKAGHFIHREDPATTAEKVIAYFRA